MKIKTGVLFFACVLTAAVVVFGQMMSGRLSAAAYEKYQNSLQADTTLAQDDARKVEEQSGKLITLLKMSTPPSNNVLRPQIESFNNSLNGFNISAAAVNLNVKSLRFDMEISLKKDKEEAMRKDITTYLKLSAEDVDNLRKRGLNYSEILIAHNLTNLLSRTPGATLGTSTEKVYLLREAGKGWGDIFREFKVKQQHLPALGDELLMVPKLATVQGGPPSGSENGNEKK
jgi:hypothetical protein